MASQHPEVDEVLAYWFGDWDDEQPLRKPDANLARWWRKSAETDDEIRERFGALHSEAHAGKRSHWREDARSALALVIVLDQFSRVIHRDTAKAFASDERARGVVRVALSRGFDTTLTFGERVFLYMPLMHSEEIVDHKRATALFTAIADDAKRAKCPRADNYAGNLEFERKHRVIIERFGRYPHRNAILSRPSTPEEQTFLMQPGSSF